MISRSHTDIKQAASANVLVAFLFLCRAYFANDVVRVPFELTIQPAEDYQEASVYSLEVVGENLTTQSSAYFQVGKIILDAEQRKRQFELTMKTVIRLINALVSGNWELKFAPVK